jgi:glutaminase
MMSCGMYDAAGDWLTTVGIPAKSGVAGGILGVLPGQVSMQPFHPNWMNMVIVSVGLI